MNFRLFTYTLLLVLTLSGCATPFANSTNQDHFFQQADFNIARISLHKISILGLIDQTVTLKPKEKEQLTQNIFDAFAEQVDSENLISTNALVKQIGVSNYQQLNYAAKENNFIKMSEIMNNAQANRYLLTVYLTSNVDHGDKTYILDSCRYYGHSISLKMAILDTQTNDLAWYGNVDKSNKQQYCDNDTFDHEYSNDRDDATKELLGLLVVGLLVSAVHDIITDNKSASKNGRLSQVFDLAIDDFAQHLPSFYH